MSRPNFLSMKLSDDEEKALIIWADSEGLDKSVLMRRCFRLALQAAPRTLFPSAIAESLNLPAGIQS